MAGKKNRARALRAKRLEDARPWLVSELMKRRTRRAARVHAEYLIRGEKPDYLQLGKIYRPDQTEPKYITLAWRRMCRQPLVNHMINQEIIAALFGEGIDQAEVIKMYKKAYDMAEGTERAEAMAKIADRFAVMLGMDKSASEAPQQVVHESHMIEDATFHELVEAERARRDAVQDPGAEGEGSNGVAGEPHLLGEASPAPRDEAA